MASSDQRQNDDELYLITMNANGPSGEDQTDRRKELLAELLLKEKPHLVFVQEFLWADIDASWSNYVKSRYQYSGFALKKNVGFVFDKKIIDLISPDEQILTKCEIPDEYLARMSICIIEIRGKPNVKRLGISWHGPRIGLDDKKKKTWAGNFLSMVNRMKENFDCPVIVGGDFNLKAEIVQECIPTVRVEGHDIKTLQVHSTTKTSIDMFLVDKDLKINEQPEPIEWFTDARQRNDPKTGLIIFDHDAVPLRLQIRKKRG